MLLVLATPAAAVGALGLQWGGAAGFGGRLNSWSVCVQGGVGTMGEIAVEAYSPLPSLHPPHYLHHTGETQDIPALHPHGSSLPLPQPFLDYLARSGIDPSIYSAAQTLPRYIRIKAGFEDEISSIEVELDCKLSRLPWLQGFYSLPQEAHIASSLAYRAGKIYGMDAASGAAVQALGVVKGDHVLDLCAAPGAKLCMVADQLGESGTLTGVDIARHRLAACRTMLLKYGIGKCCRLFVADGTSFTLLPSQRGTIDKDIEFPNKGADGALGDWTSRKTRKEKKRDAKMAKLKTKSEKPELLFYGNGSGVVGLKKEDLFENCCMIGRECSENGYDKVLVDAECTHDGSLKHICKYEQWGWETLERRVLDHDRLVSITNLQLQLLTNGFRLLKAGGTLIYSTCSFTTAQNEEVVEKFLGNHSNAELVEIDECKKNNWPCKSGHLTHTLRFDPISSSTSGLFLAKIKKSL
eukprot:c18742_g1_i1 orf=116-1516(+)